MEEVITLKEKLQEFLKDKDMALLIIKTYINLINTVIDELEDLEIESKFRELEDLLNSKVELLGNKKIKK